MGNSESAAASLRQQLALNDEEVASLSTRFAELTGAAPPPAPDARVSRDAYAAAFGVESCPAMGGGMYDLIVREWADGEGMDFPAFARGAVRFSRGASNTILRHFLRCLPGGGDGEDEPVTRERAAALLSVCLELAGAPAGPGDDPLPLAVDAVFSAAPSQDLPAFLAFVNECLPHLPRVLTSWMAPLCFSTAVPASFRPYRGPSLVDGPSDVASLRDTALLSLYSEPLQGEWTRLYTTQSDGTSFNRVCHHVLGYAGATVVLVRDRGGAAFGMAATERWKESNSFYGSSGCFLFRLRPSFAILRPKLGGDDHFMYLNMKGYRLPHGLGMGGSTDGFRLFIPEAMEACAARQSDSTFEAGALASSGSFEIETLEVWGCGGDEALRAQAKHRSNRADLVRKARTVDKAQFANSDFDREMFLSKTFGGGGAAAKRDFSA